MTAAVATRSARPAAPQRWSRDRAMARRVERPAAGDARQKVRFEHRARRLQVYCHCVSLLTDLGASY